TPSQFYVFMPPNLGGFFMVRSYYPSECHADYFDFERIEALKPAIEACEIGRASCRERGEVSGGACGVKKKKAYGGAMERGIQSRNHDGVYVWCRDRWG